VLNDLRDGHRKMARVAHLSWFAVDSAFYLEVVDVLDVLPRYHARPKGRKGIHVLSEIEKAGFHLLSLDVACGYVVKDGEASDRLPRALFGQVLGLLADDYGHFDLVVKLFCVSRADYLAFVADYC